MKGCYHRDCLRSISSHGRSHTERQINVVNDASDVNMSYILDSDAALMAKIQAADDNNVFMRCEKFRSTCKCDRMIVVMRNQQ